MPRAIESIRARLHHVAEDRVIEFSGIDAGPPNRFFRSVRRQINRAHVRKCARVARHRRPRPRHNHYVPWKHAFLISSSSFLQFQFTVETHGQPIVVTKSTASFVAVVPSSLRLRERHLEYRPPALARLQTHAPTMVLADLLHNRQRG